MIRRMAVVLLGAIMVAGSAAVALANHGAWANGCHAGATCWWDGSLGWSANVHSDHRDIDTFPNAYSSGNSIGWSTDYIENDMNSYHAHIYRWDNYDVHLVCINPGSSYVYDARGTQTGSWLGHPGSLSWCR